MQSAIHLLYRFSEMSFPTNPYAGLPDLEPIRPWFIWCGERGFEVLAEACKNGLRILFRFSLDASFRQSEHSRIATFYHELAVKEKVETFPDIEAAREAIALSITKVWNACEEHPSIKIPDVVVEIYEDAEHRWQWIVSHLSVYNDYTKKLRSLRQVLHEEVPLDGYDTFETVDVPSLHYHESLGGRGDAKLVHKSSYPESLFVFKGLDMMKYLLYASEFDHYKDRLYHEIRTIRSLPRHPNIIPPAKTYVTALEMTEEPGKAFICGTLQPYMRHRTVDDYVRKYNKLGERIPLPAKARWCFQLTSAIAHTHHIAKTYHMNIKPTNILLDDNLDLLLIDWEQSGTSFCTVAPEADGTWDIESVDTGFGSLKLVYKKYHGPERRNAHFARPGWNVFPKWRDQYPWALEAAEVYSVGRTMWMLLEQVEQGDSDESAVAVYWQSADIPESWRTAVGRCLETEPQKRMKLVEMMSFWKVATM